MHITNNKSLQQNNGDTKKKREERKLPDQVGQELLWTTLAFLQQCSCKQLFPHLIIISINAGIISLENKPLWKFRVLLIFDVLRESLLRAVEKMQTQLSSGGLVRNLRKLSGHSESYIRGIIKAGKDQKVELPTKMHSDMQEPALEETLRS